MKNFVHKTSLAVVGLLASLTASAHDFEVDGIYYNIINDTSKTVEVTYKGYSPTEYEKEYSGGVDIPSNVTYNGVTYTVTQIGVEAFYECSELTDLTIPNTIDGIADQFIGCTGLTAVNISDLSAWCKINFASQTANPLSLCQKLILNGEVVKELIIPEDITEIGGWTFRCCTELTSVKIHNSVSKIGRGAFEDCIGLTSITIPESVTEIWDSAFSGCSKLSNIDIHDSVTHIGDLAFYDTEWYNTNIQANNVLYLGCYCIRGYAYGNLAVKTGTRLIADGAFEDCTGITSVNLPNTLVSIGTYAFSKCTNLETVSISNSVKDIGLAAFYGCENLQNINVDAGNPSYSSIDGVLFNADKTELVAYPSGRNGEYSVPDGVKTFAYRAFAKCTGLTGITLPSTLVSTGESAFEYCTGLTSITIPNSVTNIGGESFYYCTGLTSITIPNSVTEIGVGAFSNCTNLSSITLSNSLTSIGKVAFRGCTGLTSITIPKSVTNVDNGAFYRCTNLTEVTIQDISAWCNIEFGSNDANPLYYSGHIRFNGAEVTELNIPSGTPTINDYAFVNCSNLTTVVIPNSVTSIGTYAFQNCTGLPAITIPENTTRIGHCAFYGCTGLTDITIPKSVEYLGQSVFNGCTNLTTLNFDAENCSCDGGLFGFGGAPLKNVNIGNTVRIIPNGTFYSCQNITEIVIPNSVVEIGYSAFNNCTGLTSIVIPKSVTSIGGAAFSRCSNLTEITSLNTTPPVCGNDYTFYGFVDSCQLKVPANTKDLYATSYGWSQFSNIIEIATVEVSTQESNATFEIPIVEGAVTYTVNVYSDEAMTQLVATTNYDAAGNIIPMSTFLELSIRGFEDGTYYYDVIAKSVSGEALNNYTGSFEIVTSGVGCVESSDNAVEVARYDIHGRLLDGPTKGVNIVIMSDGTIRKEILR